MNDATQVAEGLLWFFMMGVSVLGVLLLLASAHLIGGALKPRRRTTAGPDVPQKSRPAASVAREQTEQWHSTETTAA